MERKCLQQITGSCLGCNVLNITVSKMNREENSNKILLDVQSNLCPTGDTIQTHHLKYPKAGMGQPDSNIIKLDK